MARCRQDLEGCNHRTLGASPLSWTGHACQILVYEPFYPVVKVRKQRLPAVTQLASDKAGTGTQSLWAPTPV